MYERNVGKASYALIRSALTCAKDQPFLSFSFLSSPRKAVHIGLILSLFTGTTVFAQKSVETPNVGKEVRLLESVQSVSVVGSESLGFPPPEYNDKALDYYQACQAGDSVSCIDLGWMYVYGVRAVGAAVEAIERAQKACDLDQALGCINLDGLQRKADGVEDYPDIAQKLFQKACDGDEARGCVSLGDVYASSEVYYGLSNVVAKDGNRIAALYQKACDLNNAGGCNALGGIYHSGRYGIAEDMARGILLYRKACDLDARHGCSNLGISYRKGTGVAKDSIRAAALFEKACDADRPIGCSLLGAMYEDGEGVEKDATIAAALRHKTCEIGPTFCDKL